MSRGDRLRSLIARPGYTIVPGAYDPLSARLVELAGFETVYVTGGGVSRAQGMPDLGLLTMTEVTQLLCRVCDSVSIPVLADMDSGYGNAVNVVRAVREFERAGVAGFHSEDQVSPKRCGHYEGKQVVSIREMVGKIKAAVDTRCDAATVVIARTDARAVEGLDRAIERAQVYVEAGADVAFVEAPQSREELAEIPRRIDGPTLVNVFTGGKTPVASAKELEDMGYRLGIYPSQLQRAAMQAVQHVLQALRRNGDTTAVEHELATFTEREIAVDAERWRMIERTYVNDLATETSA
jgi:2-methylisocitrate lyase-like PEP mutase family enzyme